MVYIPKKVEIMLWLKSGGRCEYPGCAKALWRDEVTRTSMNTAYKAHIIASSSDGPRGDDALSEELAQDLDNLMLLCDAHHRLIDTQDEEGHPSELLRRYKREHEKRIEHLTRMQPSKKTHVLMLSSNIGERKGRVSFEEARRAILPERYPSTDTGIHLNLAESALRDDDDEFWALASKDISRQVKVRLERGPNGKPISHLSIFALAPIPCLIHLGKEVGDIVSADVYQRQRGAGDWTWKALEDEDFEYQVVKPEKGEGDHARVALNLSLSGTIQQEAIYEVMDEPDHTYTLTIRRPRRTFLKSQEQLELFSSTFKELLSEIREAHGEHTEIHLFPAVPNSVAVQIGRLLLPKADPPLHIYDYNRRLGGFTFALTV